ncbi:HET-domain-containing protein [Nemania abortiva]|nr:HET-domain-containing protein [Nemania abortiva]
MRLLSVSWVGPKRTHYDLECERQRELSSAKYINLRRSEIKHELVENYLQMEYLPDSSLPNVIEDTDFETMLPGASEQLIHFICTEASKVFLATLMSYNWSGHVLRDVFERFQEMDFTDKALPIEDITKKNVCSNFDVTSDGCSHNSTLDVFHEQWDVAAVEAFHRNQWKFIAPVFMRDNIERFNQELPHGTILPFRRKQPTGGGHFSDVFEARLRADHQDTLDPDDNDEVQVAIKELKTSIGSEVSYDPEIAWKQEADTWNKLGALDHPHLIRHIASFKYDGAYSIMFEWANGGTLRDFWRRNPTPHIKLTGERIWELLGQIRGLAEALHKLHHPGHGGNTNWRHGDLKPENILVFRDLLSWLGTLKIADLGLAKEHELATTYRVNATSTKHTTLHYEAPEAITNSNMPRSRIYDIWSIGCTIFESIVWILYGLEELDKFHEAKKALNLQEEGTLYFTITKDNHGSVAMVSERATKWMEEMLLNDPELQQPTALRDLLLLVKDELLVLEEFRADSPRLVTRLKDIEANARKSDDYLFMSKGQSRVGISSTLHIPNGQAHHANLTKPTLQESWLLSLKTIDGTWEVFPDDIMSAHLMKTRGRNALRIFPMAEASLCERCLTLNFRALGLVAREQVTFLKSRAKTCTLCDLFLRVFDTSNMSSASIEIWRVKGGLALSGQGTPVLSIYGASSPNALFGPQLQDISTGIPKIAAIGSHEHFDLIRKWVQDCDGNHASCRPETTESSLIRRPTRLIDVKQHGSPIVRLLKTQKIQIDSLRLMEYIALSHPWGAEHSHFRTTQFNIRDHETEIPIDLLPNTFKDAVEVTRQLGLKYLWIDSLCIVQGDGGDFEEEAKHMETVFSSAYCVIAATCASGMSSGFLKSRPDRKIVRFEQPGAPGLYICESIDNFQRDVLEGALNKRGWVLQERVLARRTIYFAENQTYWECGEGIRCETLIRMRNKQVAFLGDPKFPKVATGSTKGGQIYLYELLYKQYSRLQFTMSYDRPLAIAGIEQRLIRAFKTHGGYGVFTCYFGRSLLWQRDTRLQSVMTPIHFPTSQKYKVPSWSWMAYEGAIDFMDLPFGKVNWEEGEIRSPWSPPSLATPSSSHLSIISNASWHTADKNGRNDLTAIARDFSTSADARIVYDGGKRPRDQIVKCVLVGRSKTSMRMDNEKFYYVLVIAQKQDARSYERIGVGTLPGSLITLKQTGLRVQVF